MNVKELLHAFSFKRKKFKDAGIQETELEQLNISIQKAEMLKNFIEEPVWIEVLEPLLDKMISDILGGREEDGKWYNGSLTNVQAKNHIDLVYAQAQKSALISFKNMIYECIESAEEARKLFELELKKKEELRSYMDSEYRPGGNYEFTA